MACFNIEILNIKHFIKVECSHTSRTYDNSQVKLAESHISYLSIILL